MNNEYVRLVEERNLFEQATNFVLEEAQEAQTVESFFESMNTLEEGLLSDKLIKYVKNNLSAVLKEVIDFLMSRNENKSPEEEKLIKALSDYGKSMEGRSFDGTPEGSLNKSMSRVGKDTGVQINT